MENVLMPEPGVIAPPLRPDMDRRLASTQKCGHADCKCMVSSDEVYCSDYCSSMAPGDQAAPDKSAAEHGCNCGHDDCASAS